MDNHAMILNDPAYLSLKQYYVEHPIALYTGAGVSWTNDDKYGLPGWNGFVRQILVEHEGPNAAAVEEFDQHLSREWKDKPWQMAQWVADLCGNEIFQELLVKIVQREENFPKKWKQLSEKFLNRAPTLNAVSAFCTLPVGIVEGTKYRTYRVAPNPRVRTIVTSNYDPFLEAASSSMFITDMLKPVGAFGSHVGRLDQIPVFHVHGYVPYPARQTPTKDRIPLVDPVITTDDYEQAWRPMDVYCPTMGLYIYVLRHYVTLFVGFSFRDQKVNELLKCLNQEQVKRPDRVYHYAIMHRNEVEKKLIQEQSFFTDIGVKPIAVNDFAEIPMILGQLYQQGLVYDYRGERIDLPVVKKRTGRPTEKYVGLSTAVCWSELLQCRNRAVRERQVTPG